MSGQSVKRLCQGCGIRLAVYFMVGTIAGILNATALHEHEPGEHLLISCERFIQGGLNRGRL